MGSQEGKEEMVGLLSLSPPCHGKPIPYNSYGASIWLWSSICGDAAAAWNKHGRVIFKKPSEVFRWWVHIQGDELFLGSTGCFFELSWRSWIWQRLLPQLWGIRKLSENSHLWCNCFWSCTKLPINEFSYYSFIAGCIWMKLNHQGTVFVYH